MSRNRYYKDPYGNLRFRNSGKKVIPYKKINRGSYRDNNIWLVFRVFVWVLVIFAMLDASPWVMNKVSSFFVIILTSLITSVIIGGVIEKWGFKWLKNISFIWKVWKFRISITAFPIAVFLLKKIIFR